MGGQPMMEQVGGQPMMEQETMSETTEEKPISSTNQMEYETLRARLPQEISDEVLFKLPTACQGLSLERIRRGLSKVIAHLQIQMHLLPSYLPLLHRIQNLRILP